MTTLKRKNDEASTLAALDRLSKDPTLSKSRRGEIAEALFALRAGARGQREAEGRIDREWRGDANCVVIHDLRIKHAGEVAEIDHLILHRRLGCHLIESRGLGRGVRISGRDEWEARSRGGWKSIPSPFREIRRRLDLLEAFIREHRLTPKRIGFALPLRFHGWLLVSANCPLRPQVCETDHVVKIDTLRKEFLKLQRSGNLFERSLSLARTVSRESIEQLGEALVAAHQPATFDFAARFRVSAATLAAGGGESSDPEFDGAPHRFS